MTEINLYHHTYRVLWRDSEQWHYSGLSVFRSRPALVAGLLGCLENGKRMCNSDAMYRHGLHWNIKIIIARTGITGSWPVGVSSKLKTGRVVQVQVTVPTWTQS